MMHLVGGRRSFESVLTKFDLFACRHSMDGGGRSARYARPPPPVPVHTDTTRVRPVNLNSITLDQVRTGPRPQNEYVDNPTAQLPAIPPRSRTQQPAVNHRDILHTIVPRPENQTLLQERTTTLSALSPPPIFRQPTTTAKVPKPHDTAKDSVVNKDDSNELARHSTSESIICHRCGRCKCHQCTQYRELPTRWVCNNKIRCSATDLVEGCTCLCGVRALFYHCLSDPDGDCGEGATDNPCGCCEQAHCCKRWTAMGLMSLVLPCLCFYWPLRCAVAGCTACYNRCTHRGCRCRKDKTQNMSSRLLIDSESSSA